MKTRNINFAMMIEAMLTKTKINPIEANPPNGASFDNRCVGPTNKNLAIPRTEEMTEADHVAQNSVQFSAIIEPGCKAMRHVSIIICGTLSRKGSKREVHIYVSIIM